MHNRLGINVDGRSVQGGPQHGNGGDASRKGWESSALITARLDSRAGIDLSDV
jgi:hypothetical protein